MGNIKIGVFGCGTRSEYVVKNLLLLNCEITAICDSREEAKKTMLGTVGKNCACYDDFDSFIEHKMDAVVLNNFFHEHAPYAIRCLEKGIHVLSECTACGTMAEGVELIRAAEKSNAIYMLAENYPQMIFNREMQRVCKGGTLGKILFAEGEYNHPGNPYNNEAKKLYNYFEKHWRNFLPRSYYITHSLGPVMCATGATPKKVMSFASFAPPPEDSPIASNVGDRVSIILTQNDDGSIFRITGCAGFGREENSYRICGTKGQIENIRNMNGKVMLSYNSWEKPADKPSVSIYEPEWHDKDEALIAGSEHGGGDFITVRMFIECIKEKRQPEMPFDVHSAVNMSSVAILAHRSMLEGGKPYDIPDFHLEEDRRKYENDRLTPFYGTDGSKPNIPCCSVTNYKASKVQLTKYREALEK